jgi:C-terminal processing protease CtpA/Prc
MRAFRFGWLALLAVSMLMAAPVPRTPNVKDRKQLQAESRRFAQHVQSVIEQIVQTYVRPVKREDLMEAAITGLYEAAHKPVPRDLRNQVRQAISMSSTLLQVILRGDEADTRQVQDPREKLLANIREELGNAEGLAKVDAVVTCCNAMTRLLDPHSGIVTALEQQRSIGLDQESFGAGLELRDLSSASAPLVVEGVQLGSSAQRAGLRPGDVITHIDGKPVEKAPPEKLLALRNQRILAEATRLTPDDPEKPAPPEPPGAFRVSYHRPGEKVQREAALLRERYRPEAVLGVSRRDDNTWNYFLDEKEKIAHVRLTALSRGTAEGLRVVLTELTYQNVRGVILDLRWCPGGYLNESVDVADLFLGNAVISTVKARGREDVHYRSTDVGKFRDFPLVVLVNGETSGGAELIAAAVQDHHRGMVVGQRTRGKASVQSPIAVGITGISFKLTTGTFHRPSGKNLHRFRDSTTRDDWGVVPDEDCRLSAELGKRLGEWWRTYSLRPARSRERLELDDPRADSQRQAAVEVMKRALVKKAE